MLTHAMNRKVIMDFTGEMPERQAQPSAVPPMTEPCPLCGHASVPYDQRLSTLLDTVALLMSVVQDLKASGEESAS